MSYAVRFAVLGSLALSALIPPVAFAQNINSNTYWDDVKYLASPELKGRATGSLELESAAAHIAGLFQSFGLKPLDGKNFEMAFPAEIGAKLGPHNEFSFTDGGAKRTLALNRDFVPFSFSTVGRSSDDVVFAGYGITALPIITTITPISTSKESWC